MFRNINVKKTLATVPYLRQAKFQSKHIIGRLFTERIRKKIKFQEP